MDLESPKQGYLQNFPEFLMSPLELELAGQGGTSAYVCPSPRLPIFVQNLKAGLDDIL